MSQGKKRASPGADEEKNPLGSVELSDQHATKLQQLTRDFNRIEIALERLSHQKFLRHFTERRAVLKGIDHFWSLTLLNSPGVAEHAQHPKDQQALSYLEDVWVERHADESRVFTLEFHFKPNPYFSDTVLKKEYKYTLPPAAKGDKPDEDGVTETMVDFSWERDVEPQAFKINWKDDAHNLTKLYPRTKDSDDDDIPAESGSFFNFFEVAEDPFELGLHIAGQIWPDAIDYFMGKIGGEDDSDEDDEDEDDSDEDEIDLEKPKVKRVKKA